MINTQTQIDSLIDLAVLQRTELKQLVDSLPQLRDHLSSEIERNLEEIEPAIRSELEQFVAARALDTQAKTSAELSAKLDAMARNLESTTAAKYSVLMAERAENANLLAKAEARIEDAASMLSHAVKEIVTDELSRFPRAGEIDQLRKEFAEPRGLNPRGRWQVGETYNKLDLVSYNGDSYVSSTDGNREKPSRSSEAWTLSAARGNGGGGGGATSLTDLVPVPANGELLIGNGSAFVNNTLTAGTGVTITNGPGTITIDASGAQELLTASVVNAESVPITRGQVVYLFSATGFRPSVKLANNSADATSAKTFGVVSDNSIAANGIGTVTCVGVVDKLALGAYNDGDTVYLGDTAGTITTTKPYAPNHLVYVGIIERANNGNGELYVKIQNGYELDEIHDVQITSAPLAGALLMRDATNSLWKANRLTGTTNQVTVTNADTAVTLSLPTTIANVNSVTAQTATNLTLTGGSTGASLVLGQGANAGSTLSSTGSGSVLLSPGTSGAVNVNSVTGVGKFNGRTGTNENFHFRTATAIGGTGVGLDMLNDANGATVGFTLRASATRLTGGTISVTDTTAASSTASGAVVIGNGTAGGLGVGGSIRAGSQIVSGYATVGGQTPGGAFTASSTDPRLFLNNTSAAADTGSWNFRSDSSGTLQISTGNDAVTAGTVALAFTRSTGTPTNANFNITTSASSSTVGALTIGNGTAATNVAIGGGNINAGGTLTAASGAITKTASANEAQISFTNDNRTGYFGIGGSTNAATTLRDKFYLYGLGGTVIATWDGSGNQVLTGTTASTGAGTGALQVAGGIYAGAASVFGGSTTHNGSATFNGGARIIADGGTVSATGLGFTAGNGFFYTGSNVLRFAAASTEAMTLSATAATFAGAVTAGGNVAMPSGSTLSFGAGVSPGNSYTLYGTGALTYLNVPSGGTIRMSDNNSTALLSMSLAGGASFYGAGTFGGLISSTQAGSAAAAVEAARLTNTTTTGSVYLNFNETNSAATPAYLIRYGSTHASSANILELAATGTGAKFRVLPAMSISNTTAGSAGAGALVVSGGLATGAASYIGGNLTVGTGAAAVASILNRGTTAQSSLAQWQTASALNWSVGSGATGTNTNLEFYNHNTASSNLTLNYTTGAATFAGTISPQQATTGGAPAYVKGAIYFDTTLNKLRVGGATGWETITSV